MTGNLLGEPFDGYVRDQIETRQQVYGSGYDSLRTPEQINYLNNRNAWIKMASSVFIQEKYYPTLKEIGISNPESFPGSNLAQKSVLFNGLSSVIPSTFKTNEQGEITSRTYGSYQSRSGVTDKKDTIWNQNFAYGLGGTDYGIQPMPGIIDFSVEAVNRGSIRKGTVTIKAFNKFQFELIELLYIRLGYTMLVEWGWDRYITKDKNDNTVVESVGNTIIEDIWFNKNDYTQIKILQTIERYRGYYSGNYDAFFGRVSNFDWKFNPDGSYDITLNLITIGDVIESLKIINNVTTLNLGTLESLVNEVETYKNLENSNIVKNAKNNILSQYLFTSINNPKLFPNIVPKNSEYAKLSNPFLSNVDKNGYNYQYFITFKELLNLIQTDIIPEIIGKNGSSFSPMLRFETNEFTNLCTSYKNLISPDPRVCLVKPRSFTIPQNSILAIKNIYNSLNNLKEFTEIEQDSTEGSSKYFVYGKVMNIYLNYEFISQKLVNNFNKTEFSIYQFLKDICDGINKCFGGVMNLEPVIKDDYIVTIIDQNSLPENLYKKLNINSNYSNNKPPVEFEVYGFNQSNNASNFVKNISFKTKITPQLSSQISIGATAEGIGTQNYEATAFSKWNDGLDDRYNNQITQKENPSSPIIVSGSYTREYIDEQWEQSTNTGILWWNEEDEKDVIIIDGDFRLEKNNVTKDELWETYQTEWKNYVKKRASGKSKKEEDDYKNSWERWVKQHFGPTLRYLTFQEDIINEGLDLWKIFYKKLINQNYQKSSSKKTVNTIGFIPLVFDLTTEGISGIKIYQQLNINQNFLPRQYPNSFKFLISKVNHKISDNNWETQLNTLSTSNIEVAEEDIDTTSFSITDSFLTDEELISSDEIEKQNNKRRYNINTLKISNKGLEEIKGSESFIPRAYGDLNPNKVLTSPEDIEGVLTIGYGFTKNVIPNLQWDTTITRFEADKLLREKIVTYENIVKRQINVPLTQGEFDALVSIVYNSGNLSNTSAGNPTPLLDTINNKGYGQAANIIPEYRVTSGGRVLSGLINRRRREQDLYLS